MPVFEGSKREHEPYGLKSHDWREYLVVIESFDLREASSHKASFLLPIGFFIKDPTVFDYSFVLWAINEFIDVSVLEGI